MIEVKYKEGSLFTSSQSNAYRYKNATHVEYHPEERMFYLFDEADEFIAFIPNEGIAHIRHVSVSIDGVAE